MKQIKEQIVNDWPFKNLHMLYKDLLDRFPSHALGKGDSEEVLFNAMLVLAKDGKPRLKGKKLKESILSEMNTYKIELLKKLY